MSSSLAYPGIQDLIISTQQLWSSTKITAAIAAAIDPTMKAPEAFAPAGTYPVTYGGAAVEKGDTFRITAPGTMGAITVNTEDLLIALIDTPAQVDANWMVAESNRDQATETVKGVAELATQVEADAGTNDTNIMTPLKTATAPVRAHDIDPAAGPHTGGLPEASSEFDDATGHAHTGAAGNGTVVAHSDTSGQGTDDHHNEAHQLDPSGGPHTGTTPEASVVFDAAGHGHSGGADGKAVAHSDTSGKTTDDHHAKLHAGDHVNGTDDIQNATNSQKGVATAAQITLLEKLENMPVNNQTGTSYTPVLTDANKWLVCTNAAAFAFTIPTNAAVAFPIGASFPVVRGGTGSLTFDHAGVTVYGELVITDQYFVAVCKKLATDTWIIVGGTGDAAIPATLFDATTFLYATLDNTPEPKTPAEVRGILNVEDGADVTDDTNVRAALAAATATIDVNGQTVSNVGTVDGRDVSADGSTLDTHVADTANPHGTDVENLGVGTLAELNGAISDAVLDDEDDPRPADEIITTTGPTTLAVGAVADGEFLKRSGATVIGDTPGTVTEILDWIPTPEHPLNGGATQGLFNSANLQGFTCKVDRDVTFNRLVLHSGVSLSGTFTARAVIYQATDGGGGTTWAKLYEGTFTNAVGANTTFEVADLGAGDITLKAGVYALVIGRSSGTGSPWLEAFTITNTSLFTNSLASNTRPTIWNNAGSASSAPATVDPTAQAASTTTKCMAHRFKKV